ncbi:MAG TPA: hypothetical protein VGM32_12610 [Rhodopila sp.]
MPLGIIQVIALADPTSWILALWPKAIETVLPDPNISSLVQPPLKVSLLLLPAISAPPPQSSVAV